MTKGETITLQDAYAQYHVSIATLRYWLDKGELTRHYDEKRRVAIDVAELEQRLKRQEEERRRGKDDASPAA